MFGKTVGILSATYLVLATVMPVGAAPAAHTTTSDASSSIEWIVKPVYMPTVQQAKAKAATHPLAGNMSYHGGSVEKTPKVYIIEWGWTSDPTGEGAYLTNMFKGLGGSAWNGLDDQYYETARGHITNPKMVLGGVWKDTAHRAPSSPSDSQMAQEAVYGEAHFGFDQDADYFVATAHNKNTPGFGSSFCGWHGTARTSAGTISFTNMPYVTDGGQNCGAYSVSGLRDGVSIIAGHEYAETATDARLGGWWYNPYGLAGEIGDLCAWQGLGNIHLKTGNFAMQPLWSNRAGGCSMR